MFYIMGHDKKVVEMCYFYFILFPIISIKILLENQH